MSKAKDVMSMLELAKSATPEDIIKLVSKKDNKLTLKQFGYKGEVIKDGDIHPDFLAWVKLQDFDKLDKIFRSLK